MFFSTVMGLEAKAQVEWTGSHGGSFLVAFVPLYFVIQEMILCLMLHW